MNKKKLIFITIPLLIILVFLLMPDSAPKCNISEELKDFDKKGAGACLILEEDKVILVRQSFSNKIGLPGGMKKRKESAACTAHREVYEELGINVEIEELLYVSPNEKFFIFSCLTEGQINYDYKKFLEIKEVIGIEKDQLSKQKHIRYPKQIKAVEILLEAK